MKFLLSVKTVIKLFITQGIIMNENMDTARDKKCASRRRIIRKAFSLPAGSTLRSHTPLSQEVAFARAVLFPSFIRKWVLRRAYERCKVIGEIVKKLKNPSFEHVLQIAASTVNPDPITRDLNAKGNYKRRVSSKKANQRVFIAQVKSAEATPDPVFNGAMSQVSCRFGDEFCTGLESALYAFHLTQNLP